ncbi:hypothetical protein PS723_00207 [Pseudomonas fluorescens]|uniref:Uncharacterized protein n=1 Tax=Pseudomonas fluorescens TaxID=294 RepID=A0A5E6ZSK3_PSEFL|nr:hypothetical protein PS723_00207 [Pseudomonas fluorescens]
MYFVDWVHIRCYCHGDLGFRPYGGSLGKAPSNQGLLPRHSVPRLGSACPHSGIAPGARRHRPSMAGGGYRGILAAVPPAQRLRSASGKGAADLQPKQRQRQKQRQDQKIAASLRSTAPTGGGQGVCWSFPRGNQVRTRTLQRIGRPVGRLALAVAVHAPSRGRAQVLRSGQPGMDAGLAAPGHGWPMAAGPRSRTGARVCRALARHRTKGARALGYLGLFQVTRREGGTLSRRYRSNGYVHHQKPGRLSGRHPFS